MPEKFYAELLLRSERDRANDRMDIALCDASGTTRTISLSPDAISALTSLLADHAQKSNAVSNVTKLPESFAVGHGRHEPVVMLRFEEDTAYGLTAAQALGLGEALLEEAETITAKVKYPARQ